MVAKTYSTRPSVIVGIENDWQAYQFDSAVLLFGVFIENKLEERNKSGKPKYKLADLLKEPEAMKATPGKTARPSRVPTGLADPAMLLGGRAYRKF